MVLESCLRNAALSCVPNESLDQTRVEEIVMETLQDKLQTRKVRIMFSSSSYKTRMLVVLPTATNLRVF